MDISKNDFEKLNLRIGKIKAVQKHPKTDDYLLLVDLGPAHHDQQVIADLNESYTMDELVGKEVVLVQNIEPEIIEGIESYGFLLIAHKDGKPVLIQPEKEVLVGVRVSGISDTESYHHKE